MKPPRVTSGDVMLSTLSVDTDTLLQLFLGFLAAGGAAAGSLTVRRSHLYRLAAFAPLAYATEADCVAVLNACAHLAPETRRGMLSTWRRFYRWAVPRGHAAADPTRELESIPAPAGVPRPIPEPALAQALAVADAETRAMLLLGAYAGLRRAEIARVQGDDVSPDLVGFTLTVRGKGGKVRRVPVHPLLLPELDHLTGWRFPSPVRPGRPVSADYVSDRLGRVLPPPYTPHSLRHRFATMAYRGTQDLRAVQTLLGHSRPETTVRYTLISDHALIAAVQSIAA